jgi:hypothetical protein
MRQPSSYPGSRYSHGDQMGVNLGKRTGEPRHNGECVDQGHPLRTQMAQTAGMGSRRKLKITPGINTTPRQLEQGGEHAWGWQSSRGAARRMLSAQQKKHWE